MTNQLLTSHLLEVNSRANGNNESRILVQQKTALTKRGELTTALKMALLGFLMEMLCGDGFLLNNIPMLPFPFWFGPLRLQADRVRTNGRCLGLLRNCPSTVAACTYMPKRLCMSLCSA
eukprot:3339705-Amphidinium_carterae.3